MASLQKVGETYHLHFRYPTGRNGKQYRRTLGTTDAKQAQDHKVRVEGTIDLLKQGRLRLPTTTPTTDELWSFLFSGGLAQAVEAKSKKPIGQVFDAYRQSLEASPIESSSKSTERTHLGHFGRHWGKGRDIGTMKPSDIEGYIVDRLSKVSGETVNRELDTASKLWAFAIREGWATENIVRQIQRPKTRDLPTFKTWDEITKQISKGGLSKVEEAQLWETLFLRPNEIKACLDDIKTTSKAPWLYPALVFCVCTGARRSEMMRAEIGDIRDGVVWIRGKKGSRSKEIKWRDVPLHGFLAQVLDQWLANHPGGQLLFPQASGKPLNPKQAVDAFADAREGTKWEVLHGYHIFRHSFASNLARTGAPLYRVMHYMGHTNEQTARRYRHLFPDDKASDIAKLTFS